MDKINTKGYTVLDNVLSNDLFTKLKNLSEFYIERTLHRQNNSGNVCYNLFRTDNILNDFLLPQIASQDKVYNILSEVLGNRFLLKEILIYFSLPNNHLQELHSDTAPLFNNKIVNLPPHLIAVQFPMVDFDADTGGTRIVPSTQNLYDEPTRIENENKELIKTRTPQVKEKGCLIRDCRAWHGAGINNSNKIRAMYVLGFSKHWFGNPRNVSKDFYFGLDKNKRHMVNLSI